MQLKNPILGLCQQSTFMLSAAKVDQCPDDEGFEVAFAGRSNAGKSSALNTLTHASLARTSKTPGRTQLLNFFKLDDERRLVDLPGYGYAKVPIPLKQHWQRHLEAYLGSRESLKGLILMMDIRHPMTDFDLLMLDWAVASGMPMHILLTKADKLTYGAAKIPCSKCSRKFAKVGATRSPSSCSRRPSAWAWKKPTRCWPTGWNWRTRAAKRPNKPNRRQKTPDFLWGGEVRGPSSGPLGRGPDICQHLTQHRSIEGLHQPFRISEWQFTGLVQIFWK